VSHRVCIDTTVFKNFSIAKDILLTFFNRIQSENFAYEGEKEYIDKSFYQIITEFVSEDDIELDIFLELKNKYPYLHDGEICLIAYCIQNNCCFLSDDKRARRKAKKENIHPCCINNYQIGGTIGILLACFYLGIISEIKLSDIYNEMKRENRLPDKSILEFSLENC